MTTTAAAQDVGRAQGAPPAETQADGLRASPAVRAAIASIVGEMRSRQGGITGVRGPASPAHAESYEKMLARAADVRGRALLFPYIGSGFGAGPYVELGDGSVKLDMIGGIGVQFFGHSDGDLVATALEAATEDVVMQGHLMANAGAFDFAAEALEAAKKGSRLRHIFLCNSGAMANENALKVCFQRHAPAPRVLAFAHCFMGRSVTMAQIGDSAAGRDGIPLSTLVDYMPFYDHAAARRMSAGDASGQARFIDMAASHLRQYIERYPNQHACFIFELVQGEGGFNTAPREFHLELMKICKQAGIAVWDDEVQTFGRTTEMYCYDAYGLGEYVDVCCIGKLTQVCAALYTEEYNPRAGLLSATFLGSTEGLRVGRRILQRLREGGHYGPSGKHARHFQHFAAHARALAAKHPEWFPATPDVHDVCDGLGGMMRFTPFGGKKDAVMRLVRAMFDEGLIVFYCGHGPYHVRMLPPLGVLDEAIWPTVFGLVEKAMAKVAAEASVKA